MTNIGHAIGDWAEDLLSGYSRRDSDTHPKGGDAKQAPLSGAVAKPDAQPSGQNQPPKGVI